MEFLSRFRRKTWNPKGLHCYITGGSSGLGLSLATRLTEQGAHVSIVARDEAKLKEALEILEAARVDPNQIIKSYSFALNSYDASAAAIDAACVPYGGRSPDALFLCAGSSKPRFFVEMDEAELLDGMTTGYWVQAWSALAASKKMVRESAKGKIIFVSSTLGYMTFLGYASYAPAKHAMRGLADTLRSELLLYGIDIHIFFPPTMYTPGYETENKTKPSVTSKIEEGDSAMTADQAAHALLRGVYKDQVHISSNLITSLFRASTRGAAPYHNPFADACLGIIAWIGVPFWRWSVDAEVKKHRKEHLGYLAQKGLIGEKTVVN
ncbi:hypothetical protein BOTBODRAFT_56572 [Botryobasidium botryosum FD-172 SS1]|uniref:3-ketodihydrosphingosine reductase TSC10 n=1 Tax=Botryobasidium botryosum (strain FD-172 SS1) TaxID=930990 RepID=A0A067MAJ0_BOTB1|nr:hypothetical protein BOTBODRAFT_56572 [Botryobasidium botryosum FD-172 SS1]